MGWPEVLTNADKTASHHQRFIKTLVPAPSSFG